MKGNSQIAFELWKHEELHSQFEHELVMYGYMKEDNSQIEYGCIRDNSQIEYGCIRDNSQIEYGCIRDNSQIEYGCIRDNSQIEYGCIRDNSQIEYGCIRDNSQIEFEQWMHEGQFTNIYCISIMQHIFLFATTHVFIKESK